MKLEVRQFKPEVRSEEGKPRMIVGYPIVFDSLSEDLGGFRERINSDAIQFSDDVRADFNHNQDYILGRVANGTLALTVDERGVKMEAEPPDTQWARDLMVSIERGDINQGSFAFRVLPDGAKWSKPEDGGLPIRTLTNILVSRVSVVSDPAYSATQLQVRTNSEVLSEIPTAGQEAPPAESSGGVDIDLLRRKLDLSLSEIN